MQPAILADSSHSRVGVGDDGDGISVWLNDDMVEVDA